MTDRPTVAVDLDGVLNRYDGWRGEDHFAEPLPGAQDFLARLYTKYRIVVLTTRDPFATRDWLMQHDLSPFVAYVSDRKVPAVVYLDDRAVRFTGDYEEALATLMPVTEGPITPWWKPTEGAES